MLSKNKSVDEIQTIETGEKKRRIWHLRVFFIIFSLLFVPIFIGVVFKNDYYSYNQWYVVLIMLVFSLACVGMCKIFIKMRAFLTRRFWIILLSFSGALLIINITLGFALRFDPLFDLEAIYKGAIEWVESGTFMKDIEWSCDQRYFYLFPNNLGGLMFYYCLFKPFALVGITDYYAVAMIANSVLVSFTVIVTALICKKLMDASRAMLVLVFFALSAPFYMMGAVFYTDTLSILFPVLIFYVYLRLADSKTVKQRIMYGLLIGGLCAVGAMIKFTVIITLVAIVVYHVCSYGIEGIKTAWISFATAFLVMALLFAGRDIFLYSTHMNHDIARETQLPYTHWIMMSLEGRGGYNPGDYEFTYSFTDTAERNAAIRERIFERISQKGILGMALHLRNKGVVAFGDGTYAQSDFLDDRPQMSTILHDFVLYDGAHYDVYKTICHGIFSGILLLMLIGAISLVFSKGDSNILSAVVIPHICIFGLLLFFFIWEVNGRLITNYIPMIFIAAILGLSRSNNKLGIHI